MIISNNLEPLSIAINPIEQIVNIDITMIDVNKITADSMRFSNGY